MACDRCRFHVAVLYGGISAERNISLETGSNVAKALQHLGYRVSLIDVDEGFVSSVPEIECDIVFIALHGKFGEDGRLQEILEKRGIPFTGSSSLASKRGMDKVESRRLFERAGLRVAAGFVVKSGESSKVNSNALEYPLVVKPSREGSTLGISVAHNPVEFEEALSNAFLHDDVVLVEKFIKGREFTVGIIDNMALPVIEIKPKHEIFDFKCKYGDNLVEFSFDHGLNERKISTLVQCARDAYNVLECSGIARVDIILGQDDIPYVLEVNTVPGMTDHSLVPLAASKLGIKLPQLCEMAIHQALRPKITAAKRK